MKPLDLSVKVGETLTIKIDDMSRAGSGVGRLSDGRVVFVPFTAPDDLVKVKVLEIKKSYIKSELIEIIEKSKIRIEPKCKVFGNCGGCDWQHLPYSFQWKTKIKGVLHAMSRIELKSPIKEVTEYPAQEEWVYRNRIQLKGNEKYVGFYSKGTNQIVPIERCEVAYESINNKIKDLRTNAPTKEFKVELYDFDNQGVQMSWNSKNAAFGFKQINPSQNLKLISWISQNIADNSVVLDLFGGSGNLTLGLQSRVQHVFCVDIGVQKKSSHTHFEFIRSPVNQWLEKQKVLYPKPTIALLDPPRAGLDQERKSIIQNLSRLGVQKAILVGCDVDAWIKDLKAFDSHGWEVSQVAFFDFFPQTVHLESAALLTQTVG